MFTFLEPQFIQLWLWILVWELKQLCACFLPNFYTLECNSTPLCHLLQVALVILAQYFHSASWLPSNFFLIIPVSLFINEISCPVLSPRASFSHSQKITSYISETCIFLSDITTEQLKQTSDNIENCFCVAFWGKTCSVTSVCLGIPHSSGTEGRKPKDY